MKKKPTRTEEDTLCVAPLKVVLGGKEYEVKLLPILYSRPWRKEVVAALSPSLRNISVDEDDSESLVKMINQTLAETPDTIIDLFFGYARDLNRDEIEAVANDTEIAAAFAQVVDIGFLPLAKSLVETMTRLSQ